MVSVCLSTRLTSQIFLISNGSGIKKYVWKLHLAKAPLLEVCNADMHLARLGY